jgi:hypothetical protein
MKAFKSKQSEEELKFRKEKYRGTLENIMRAGADSQVLVPVNGEVETFENPSEDAENTNL